MRIKARDPPKAGAAFHLFALHQHVSQGTGRSPELLFSRLGITGRHNHKKPQPGIYEAVPPRLSSTDTIVTELSSCASKAAAPLPFALARLTLPCKTC